MCQAGFPFLKMIQADKPSAASTLSQMTIGQRWPMLATQLDYVRRLSIVTLNTFKTGFHKSQRIPISVTTPDERLYTSLSWVPLQTSSNALLTMVLVS